MKALALCHNVTPVRKKDDSTSNGESADNNSNDGDVDVDEIEEMETGSRAKENGGGINYQASSPDEVSHKLTSVIGCL